MKTTLSLDKRHWRPSVLPGQIVLVSTYDESGAPNIAPKSWISMAAFAGPRLAFGCNVAHGTYQNIQRGGCFIVNVPDASLADRIWALPGRRGADRIAQSGLSLEPGGKVNAPRIRECRAHIECTYDDVKAYGDEVMIFGLIVDISVDPECLSGTPPRQYFRLRPLFFLEDGAYGSLDTSHEVNRTPPTELDLFVVEVGELPGSIRSEAERAALLQDHLAYLRSLWEAGRLLMSGAFASGGMYFLSAASPEEALGAAAADPLVAAGAPHSVRPWRRSF
ncbi:MAG: flavin reductase [Polyangiaceae bacterium]|nr:flavin reductase [Polyangiaceae bacterium]